MNNLFDTATEIINTRTLHLSLGYRSQPIHGHELACGASTEGDGWRAQGSFARHCANARLAICEECRVASERINRSQLADEERADKMRSERQLHICAELARRMGWTTCPGGWIAPDDRILPDQPDPFTCPEDNRALVAWLANDNDQWQSFRNNLDSLNRDKYWMMDDEKQRSLPYRAYLEQAAMTAPLETITLAAARALGIPEASE